MKLRTLLALTICGLFTLAACNDSSPSEPDSGGNPAWLNNLIAQIASEPVTNPPTTIRSYRYHGEKVYYRSGSCCDIWSDLYDRNGFLISHPDGGFTGRGDGLCSDFHQVSSEQTLIWQDPR